MPIASEWALGRGQHLAVLGLGATVDQQAERRFSFDRQSSDTYLRLNGILGYRWEGLRERLFVQIHLAPGLELDPTPNQLSSTPPQGRLLAGVLLGYRFW